MPTLDEKTKFSYGLMVAIVGLCALAGQMVAQVTANARAIDELKTKQTKVEEIATDVAVIKSQVAEIRAEVHLVRTSTR